MAFRIITSLEVCAVLAGSAELYFGGPGIFVAGIPLGLLGLTIGLLTKQKGDRSKAPADVA